MEKIIVLNNKMEIASNICEVDISFSKIKLVYCPSYPFLTNQFTNIMLGSQDVSSHEQGAYTGEVSAKILKYLNVSYSLVGHSERRKYFNEDLVVIKNKINNLLNQNIIPIICISELVDQNEIEFLLDDITDLNQIILAYEPLTAIGSGIVPSNLDIELMITKIKDMVYKINKQDIKVLYGGSVNKDNIKKLNELSNVSGFLIGNASNDINQIKAIIEVLEK